MTRLALAAIFLLLFSCKKDNDSYSLIGKWKAVEVFDANTAWGGCACWKEATNQHAHELEFTLDGRFRFIYPPISSLAGCIGNYVKKNDSTLSWNRCSPDMIESEISYQHPYLFIKSSYLAGYDIYKYEKVD